MKKQSKSKRHEISTLPPIDPGQRYEIPAASSYLRESRSKTYQKIKAGTLSVIRDGGRVYVPGSEIIRLSTLPAEAA